MAAYTCSKRGKQRKISAENKKQKQGWIKEEGKSNTGLRQFEK